ncbi:MAG: helix-turn-helix domain-containing protein [Deltaproteobacteria bacterium]|nr:helix-turn-helix domain-containing protein [Deltaproteobacteria bacterium]
MKLLDEISSKKFFRPDEVADLLRLSRRTVYRMILDGRIQGVKWGAGPWRIPQASLNDLFTSDQAFI